MRLAGTTLVYFLSKVGASAIGFLATLYFARTLGASTLGVFYVVVALLAWARIPMNAINSAVTKRVSEEVSDGEFMAAGLLVSASIFATVAVGFYAFESTINQFIGAPLMEYALLLFGAQVFFYWAVACLKGQARVGRAGLYGLLEQAVRAVVQVLLVLAGFRALGLVGGMAISFAVAGIGVLLSFDRGLTRPRREHFTRLFSFAQYSWLGNLKLKTFVWMDTIVLNFFVASALIGVYEISWNLAGFLVIVSNSIGQTLFPEISRLATEDRYDEIRSLLQEALAYSGIFLIPGFFGALVLGPELLGVYGGEFQQGATVLLILILARTFDSYASQFNSVINSIDRPDVAFRINVVYVAVNLSLNVGLVFLYGMEGAAVATAVSAVLVLALDYHYLTRLVGRIELPTMIVGKQLAAAGVMAAVLLAFDRSVGVSNDYVTVAAVFGGATVYVSLLFLIEPTIRNKFRSMAA